MIFEDLAYLAVGFVTAFLVLEAEHVYSRKYLRIEAYETSLAYRGLYPQVGGSSIERDLSLQYGKRFRVLKAESGQKALESLKQLKLRDEALALLLVEKNASIFRGSFPRAGHEYFSRGQTCIVMA